MPFLTRPHCALYYEVHGDLTGPRTPLVLAHGLGGNHLSWWQQLAHFAPSRACVVFSHRGFALSPEAPGGPGLAGFADDLLALLDHLELHAPILVGQSMGGWTCTSHAAAHPDRLRALVLACTTGAITHPELDAIFTAHHARELPALPEHVSPAAGPRLAREQPAMNTLYNLVGDLTPGLDRDALTRALLAARTVPLADSSPTWISSTTRRRKYSRPRRNVRAPKSRRSARSLRPATLRAASGRPKRRRTSSTGTTSAR